MEAQRFVSLLVVILMITNLGTGQAQLSTRFYSSTCPDVETIVRTAVDNKFRQTFVTAQATLRLFFHDCFIQGCDASIMIASPSNDAEKDAPDNLTIPGDGFDTIAKAKEAVEAQCPGIVSCADIIALATRDVIVITGGPNYRVELGRRDGMVSRKSDVIGNMPEANFNFEQLVRSFARIDLSTVDMIALSGAHTLGVSHCNIFANRLYNFSSTSKVDPTLNPTYAQQLKQACPQNVDPTIAVPMDPITPVKFDNLYYQNLVDKMGMFTSDQVLFSESNSFSRSIVVEWANDQSAFFSAFATAMTKLGRVGVKTGNQGEIRRSCASFNS
uniref:Peroxidase n=1 Tax=Tamarix hispida TaxID=189793 RepID=C0KKH7_9CARY|nr:peroxidase [Tamarix hispida]